MITMTVYHTDGREEVVETDLPPTQRGNGSLFPERLHRAIYRNNWLTQHPNTDPEMLAFIVGPAVVFSDRVWY